MSNDPFATLGLSVTATVQEARRAYRKLAMKHHPDHGGDENQFKAIQRAWELIDGGWRPPPVTVNPIWRKKPEQPFAQETGWHARHSRHSHAYKTAQPKIDPINEHIVQAWRAPEDSTGPFIARVTMAEAFRGFVCEVDVDGTRYRVNIPPGVPHGLKFIVPTTTSESVIVMVRFTQNLYAFRGVDTAPLEKFMVDSRLVDIYRTGHLTMLTEIETRDLNRGTTLRLVDFLGDKYTVTVKPYHDMTTPIVVEGRGYVDWNTTDSKAVLPRRPVSINLRLIEDWRMTHLRF